MSHLYVKLGIPHLKLHRPLQSKELDKQPSWLCLFTIINSGAPVSKNKHFHPVTVNFSLWPWPRYGRDEPARQNI